MIRAVGLGGISTPVPRERGRRHRSRSGYARHCAERRSCDQLHEENPHGDEPQLADVASVRSRRSPLRGPAERHDLAYTISRNAQGNYSVTATETINQIKNIPNHNDNGQVNSGINTRLCTGLLVTGTAQKPVLYVTSSDPRIGGGAGGSDTNLDTNSGILSRLTRNGSSWTKLDLVRGLPRSEENHNCNGLALVSTAARSSSPRAATPTWARRRTTSQSFRSTRSPPPSSRSTSMRSATTPTTFRR